MALIEQLSPGRAPVVIPEVDERAARAHAAGPDRPPRARARRAPAWTPARASTPPPPVRSLAGPRLLSLGELERVRDELAGRLARVRGDADAQILRQAESRALLERDVRRPARPQVAADLQRPARRAGLQALPRPPAAGAGRHAGRLVAREGLLRLPVSLGAVTPSRPRPGHHLTDGQAQPQARDRPRERARAAGRRPRTAAPRRRGGRPSIEDRPKPPWHPVPLVELCVLIGIVLLVLGAARPRAPTGGKLLLVLRHGARLARRPGHGAARALRRLPLAHDACSPALPAVAIAAAALLRRRAVAVVVRGRAAVFAAVFWWLRRVFMRSARRRALGSRLASTPWQMRSACSCAACTTSRRSAATWSGRSRSTATCSASRSSTTARPTTIPSRATCGSARSTASRARS